MAGSKVTVEELEARLGRPDQSENGFRADLEQMTRLEALLELKRLAQKSRVGQEGGINTHIHTSKSFAFFRSPAEAVWQAYLSGVSIFGINDHYTLAGHEEFEAACRCLGIVPIFSMEAVAMWQEAERSGQTVNDPTNPGRTYLTAKGVTRPFPPGCQGDTDLRAMNASLAERNGEMTRKAASLVEAKLGVEKAISWDDVLSRTPHDQPTERHVAQTLAEFLVERYPDVSAREEATSRLVGATLSPEDLVNPARFQNALRAHVLKAGRPAYVEESSTAFIPIERMVSLGLDLGAVPTYPVLGNPVTPWEEDVESLFDRLEAIGIFSIELIPDRNERDRLLEIVEAAAARSFPILNGTEHNTKSPAPLVDRYFYDPAFHEHFVQGAYVIIAHQLLRGRGENGYVLEDGSLPSGDRQRHLERLTAIGQEHVESLKTES